MGQGTYVTTSRLFRPDDTITLVFRVEDKFRSTKNATKEKLARSFPYKLEKKLCTQLCHCHSVMGPAARSTKNATKEKLARSYTNLKRNSVPNKPNYLVGHSQGMPGPKARKPSAELLAGNALDSSIQAARLTASECGGFWHRWPSAEASYMLYHSFNGHKPQARYDSDKFTHASGSIFPSQTSCAYPN